MADGWIYRYDFENGDCYVGKEGSFDPFIRAAEHLQDALAVAYPGKYTGFKILGVIGMLLGPIILIILKNIFATMIDDGVFKSIFDR